MLYQVNNKAQAVEIVNYSVDNFQSVFETLCTMKTSNLMRTRWAMPAHAVRIDDNGVWLPYL